MNKMEKDIISMYSDKNMSTYEIAKTLKTYPNKVRRVLKKNGVEIRSKAEAQKNALEQGTSKHPTKGRKRTLEERVKISDAISEHWDLMSEEEKNRRSEIFKNTLNNMSEADKKEIKQKAVEGIRKAATSGSKLENDLAKELTGFGFKVDMHKQPFNGETLECDLTIRKLKTIIEVDGVSHFEPIWGEDKLAKQQRADQMKHGLIASRGWVLIRIKAVGKTTVGKLDKLKKELLSVLEGIKTSFPEEKDRFIEIEL